MFMLFRWRYLVLLGFTGIIVCCEASAHESRADSGQAVASQLAKQKQPDKQRQILAEHLKPRWQVGQQWIVETVSLQPQISRIQKKPVKTKPIQWRFTVSGVEPLAGRACFRLEVHPVADPSAPPVATLWIDKESMTLRQFQARLPVQGGFRTVTERYELDQQQSAPVLAPLTVLPVDMPVFQTNQADQATEIHKFSYKTFAGPFGVKANDSVSFTKNVKQSISQPEQDKVKGLLDGEFSKTLPAQPLIEVRMESHDYRVRQLWQSGSPWPVYTDNGVTQSRMIKQVSPSAADSGEKKTKPKMAAPPRNSPLESTKDLEPSSDVGRARTIPWSGYWWPLRQGAILNPLKKYDQITGKHSAEWEQKHHPAGHRVPDWHGYCHAWAASAVMEREPIQACQTTSISGEQVTLSVGEQKGLLAVCHTQDTANSYGDRYGDGAGSEDKQDLAPDTLWRLLSLYVKENGVPLILDIEPDEAVWNYPVYDYKISHKSHGNTNQRLAQLTLLMADNGVAPDFCGTKIRRQTYQFTFQMHNGSVVSGSGRWVGLSRKDHPDFAWYPLLATGENPEVEYAKVRHLAGLDCTQPAIVASTPRPSESSLSEAAAESPPSPCPQPERQTVPSVILSPSELVALIMNKTSSFALDATVDRFDGATYAIGERFSVRCSSERAGYVTLILVNAKGIPSLLFPTRGQNNRIKPDQTLVIPTEDVADGFAVDGPTGTTRIKVLVTTRPLVISGASVLQRQQEPNSHSQPKTKPIQKQKPSPGDVRAVRPVPFRWNPTQMEQIQHLFSQQIPASVSTPGLANVVEYLGPFAQDEIAIHVSRPKPRANQKLLPTK